MGRGGSITKARLEVAYTTVQVPVSKPYHLGINGCRCSCDVIKTSIDDGKDLPMALCICGH